MRIRITMPTKDGKRLKEQVTGAADTVEEDDFTSDEWEVVRPSFPFSRNVSERLTGQLASSLR